MKKFKLLMTLAFLVIGTLCGNAELRIKRIKGMTPPAIQDSITGYFCEALIECRYDTQNRLDSISWLSEHNQLWCGNQKMNHRPAGITFDTLTFSLKWKPDILSVIRTSAELSYNWEEGIVRDTCEYSFVLNTQGNATQCLLRNATTRFDYNSDQNIAGFTYRYGTSDDCLTQFTYQDGNVYKTSGIGLACWPTWYNFTNPEWDEKYRNTITYSEIPNKGNLYLPLMEWFNQDIAPMFLANIAGKPFANLPLCITTEKVTAQLEKPISTCYTTNYAYELDDEGYVKKVTQTYSLGCAYFIMEIEYEEFNSISSIETQKVSITVDGRTATTSDGTPLRAYNMQGTLIAVGQTGVVELPNSGIYILQARNHTSKVIVR